VVVGLLEVFSSRAAAFDPLDAVALQHLLEPVLTSVRSAHPTHVEPASEESPAAGAVSTDAPDQPAGAAEDTRKNLGAGPERRSYKMLRIAVAATLALFVGWWIANESLNLLKLWKRVVSATKSAPQVSEAPQIPKPTAAQRFRIDPTTVEGLRQLASEGDPAAQFALGAKYATGEGVAQDYAEAVRWFSRASEGGHVIAQATLGAYYWAGRGVSQDLKKAYFWSVLARAGGDEASKYRVAVLSSRMSRSDVIEVQQRADEWLHQHQSAAVTPSDKSR
jgi:hypothetical protein